jgi:hypothetical protein
MTGFLTKEQLETWTLEDAYLFDIHLLLTSHPYFTKRNKRTLKSLDRKLIRIFNKYANYISKSC